MLPVGHEMGPGAHRGSRIRADRVKLADCDMGAADDSRRHGFPENHVEQEPVGS